MDLLIVRDVAQVAAQGVVLNGPLLLTNVVRKSDVQCFIGKEVSVMDTTRNYQNVRIKEVTVTQTMAGGLQISLGIEFLPNEAQVLIDSVVKIGS